MYNSLFTSVWAIEQNFATQLSAMLAKAISAGPVEEAQNYNAPIEKQGSVAVIKTKGTILKYAGYLSRYGYAGTRDVQNAFIAAEQDDDIKTILWVLDTPGGSVDGLQELNAVVKATSKPVIAQVDGMLASAGYYLASAADKIYAAPDNLVGSIGVRTYMMDSSEYYKDMGVKIIPVDTGEFKSAGLQGTEITDAQVADVQRIVDGYFEQFLQVIEAGRGMDRKSVDAVADGRVFFAAEAMQKGLIDGVQTLTETTKQLQTNTQAGYSTRAARARLSALEI